MQILEGRDVDVITPFPLTMLPKAAQWMHCYKTLMFGQNSPKTTDEIEKFLQERSILDCVTSWGIVDKNNLTNSKEFEAPLVGIIYFEQSCPQNGYAHLASNRRAWGERLTKPGLMEQAGHLIIDSLFKDRQELKRISITTYSNNKAAWNMALRMGFHKDGYFKSMDILNGKLVDVVHFGKLRQEV